MWIDLSAQMVSWEEFWSQNSKCHNVWNSLMAAAKLLQQGCNWTRLMQQEDAWRCTTGQVFPLRLLQKAKGDWQQLEQREREQGGLCLEAEGKTLAGTGAVQGISGTGLSQASQRDAAGSSPFPFQHMLQGGGWDHVHMHH